MYNNKKMNKSIQKFKQGRRIQTFNGGGKKKEQKKANKSFTIKDLFNTALATTRIISPTANLLIPAAKRIYTSAKEVANTPVKELAAKALASTAYINPAIPLAVGMGLKKVAPDLLSESSTEKKTSKQESDKNLTSSKPVVTTTSVTTPQTMVQTPQKVVTEPVITSVQEGTVETPSRTMSYVQQQIPTINFPELKTTPIDQNKEVVVKVQPQNTPYIPQILPQQLPEFEVGKYRDVNGLWDYMINNPNSREAMLFSNAFGNMITNKNREAFDRVMDQWGIRGRLGRKDSGTLRNLYELLKQIGSEGTVERENFIDASNNYEDYYNHSRRYASTYKRGGLISNNPIQRFKNRKRF